jgi:hypothetical protein
MKDPGNNFVFEANGDLLFQGYLVLEAAQLPRIALELAKYLAFCLIYHICSIFYVVLFLIYSCNFPLFFISVLLF